MNEQTLIWLFGIFGAWNLVLTGLWFNMRAESKRIRLAVELFVESMGKAAVIALHSPDDHLGFDYWCDVYETRHCEMSVKEWTDMRSACEGILINPKATKIERGQARVLVAICSHKLSVFAPYVKLDTKQIR